MSTPVQGQDAENLLDARDTVALAHAVAALRGREPAGILVGEWVRFAGGTLRRVSHVWRFPADKSGPAVFAVQTSDGGSYHLTASGHVSMSGGLDRSIPGEEFLPTSQRQPGSVWIWHHGRSGKGRGVPAQVTFRVWTCEQAAP